MISAAPKAIPGWPDLALVIALAANTLKVFAANLGSIFVFHFMVLPAS
ncbi:MAG: hypothetical protein MJ201_03840 [Mycoplasmoidaceae bacterium]|nr:hypothetical protein [Mycoplasmoidaceae bacterium]